MKTADVTVGEVIRLENKVWKVLGKELAGHGKAGRVIHFRLRDLNSGTVKEQSLRPDEDVETVDTATVTLEYLFADENFYTFMNTENFEQCQFSKESIGKKAVFLKENCQIQALMIEDKPASLEFPEKVTLKVTSAPDGIREGNKEAELENGLTLLVPHIVNSGDQIVVDTEHFNYVERVTLKSMSSGQAPSGTAEKTKDAKAQTKEN